MAEYYLGLMSGTSMDGIDAALVDLQDSTPKLLCARTLAWPDALQQQLLHIVDHPQSVSLHALGQLDAAVGETFAVAAQSVIQEAGIAAKDILAIGSHGQTLFHAPNSQPAFSHQCGDPNRIAEITGITTVADFRRRDIAAGGQGAPLVPAFHQTMFSELGQDRAVLNIGGIANLTLLPGDETQVSGFDTGPGNGLMDIWCRKYRDKAHDENGAWAETGKCHPALLDSLLEHPFLKQPPPKSTGRETFSADWLEEQLARLPTIPESCDVQRTLLEFTVRTICDALKNYGGKTRQLLVCGGGIHNGFLMQRLAETLKGIETTSTETFGLHPDWVEAVAFAWLAKQTLNGKAGNLPAVTGASHPVVLGAIYPA
ncbi:Anhydro-N-acetylmuramic acid kinase [hydrothermal vent metagenome]|uniref:Anhydro-N-acetylmuramic acid kinase n=1 Tax=hydrothermal vent metagenome TaxID=652676 RepID=A0A3B0Y9I2_9ZZZZ